MCFFHHIFYYKSPIISSSSKCHFMAILSFFTLSCLSFVITIRSCVLLRRQEIILMKFCDTNFIFVRKNSAYFWKEFVTEGSRICTFNGSCDSKNYCKNLFNAHLQAIVIYYQTFCARETSGWIFSGCGHIIGCHDFFSAFSTNASTQLSNNIHIKFTIFT